MKKALNLISRIWQHPGNSSRKLHAFWNTFLMHWNISVLGKDWIFHWKTPLQLHIRKGYHSLTAQVYFDLSEYEEMSFLLDRLKPGDYFVDVGANLGVYSLLAAGVCRAKVMAIEPWPDNFEVMKEQVLLNGLEENVELLEAGASDKNGELFFQSDSSQNTSVTESRSANSHVESLPVHRLDNLLHSCPRYIKIDVEGHELQVLTGLGDYLHHPDLEVIQCETLGDKNSESLHQIWQLLLAKGFKPNKYDPKRGSLTEIKMGERANTLFVRGERKINYF